MKRMMAIALVSLLAPAGLPAKDAAETGTQNKNVTVIKAQSSADGKSEMREELLEECIVSLPAAQDVQAAVSTEAQFLRAINGDANKNEHTRTYSATIEINYMLYQKVLIVVTTNAVTAQEPVMKVMDKNIKQTKTFTSNPANGDMYAGESHRQYYFSTAEGAVSDARKQAQVWLAQQSAVVCKAR